MQNDHKGSAWKYSLIGGIAGIANGLFGAGGGLFLVPLFIRMTGMQEKKAFATSVAVIFPLSIASLIVFFVRGEPVFSNGMYFLIGGILGGVVSGKIFRKIPTVWLHRIFGAFILYGAFRNIIG